MELNKKTKNYVLGMLGRLPDFTDNDKEYLFFIEERLQYNTFDNDWYQIRHNDGRLQWNSPGTEEWFNYCDWDDNRLDLEIIQAYRNYIDSKFEEAFL